MFKIISNVLQFFAIYAIVLSSKVRSFTVAPLNNHVLAKCSPSTRTTRMPLHSPPFIKRSRGLSISIHATLDDAADRNADVGEHENDQSETDSINTIEEELERLQHTLASIEALEERNKAQLDSFVDEEDQWNSLEEFERELLESKEEIEERMEKMAEELLQMWMGAKSMEG